VVILVGQYLHKRFLEYRWAVLKDASERYGITDRRSQCATYSKVGDMP